MWDALGWEAMGVSGRHGRCCDGALKIEKRVPGADSSSSFDEAAMVPKRAEVG